MTRIVHRVLAIRDHPRNHPQRIPGPKAILYYLSQDESLRDCPQEIPRSTRIVWQILDEAGRIVRRTPSEHQLIEMRTGDDGQATIPNMPLFGYFR